MGDAGWDGDAWWADAGAEGGSQDATGEARDPAADAFACSGGATACGDRCVDILHDPANCGGCAKPCTSGQVCANGACALGCGGGTTQCGATCVELANDPANCGTCGRSCGVLGVCVNGSCATLAGSGDAGTSDASSDGAVCSGTERLCNGACTDTTSSSNDCGGCGAACMPLEVCSNSTCVCAPGAKLCGGICVNPFIDAANCRSCGVACAAGSVCTDGACAAATSNWQMFGYDAQHTGDNVEETGVPPSIDSWSAMVNASGQTLSPATIENGRVFVASSGAGTATLYAVNVSDGSILWQHPFGAVGSVGHPSVVDGTVYVQTNHGTSGTYSYLWALDAAANTLDWSVIFPSQVESYWAPLVVGSSVFVDGGGGLYGFSTVNGTKLFFDGAIGPYDAWSPAYFGGDLYTFAGGNLSSESPSTGTVLSTTSVGSNATHGSMNTAPVFGAAYGYVISPPNLVAVPTSNAQPWTAPGEYSSTPAIADGVVYGISAGNLIARDATTGALLATMVGDMNLKYPPVVAAGYVYAASDANVYAWNVTSHRQAWTAPAGGWLSIGARRLLVADTTHGVLHGFVLSP
jgi:hypothetical protein